MWRAFVISAFLVDAALIIHALPQGREGAYSWTAESSFPPLSSSTSATTTTRNHSTANIDVDQASLSKVNQSSAQVPYLSDAFDIPGTDLIADIALFQKPLSYVEIVSVLRAALEDIRRNEDPNQELRTTYTIDDEESGIDTSFFIRSGVMLTRRYLTYQDVLKVIDDGLLGWVHRRIQERKGLFVFTFRIFSTGQPFVYADGAVDRSIKVA